MILVIRIAGQVDLTAGVKETLNRIKLKRKYAAILMHETRDNLLLLRKVRNFVSFGTIGKDALKNLIKERGTALNGKKIDVEKVIAELEKKTLSQLGLKPFFRLHPPRGGIDSKKHAGTSSKSVLGENKKIDELVGRML
jgi:large subunit ribosomal protein L30